MAQKIIIKEGSLDHDVRSQINDNFSELYGTASLTQKIDYNGGSNATYIGTASPGTATSAAKWTIKLITYDANSNPLTITYANAGSSTNIWDNRTSYTYS